MAPLALTQDLDDAMYLLIDAGNTRIKYAGWDGQSSDWLFDAAVQCASEGRLAMPAGFVPRQIVAVNVAGPGVASRIEAEFADRGVPVTWFGATNALAGLRNNYENPLQLGPDRWAAAVAAWRRVAGACLVVVAGTATTIDVVSSAGVFEGGCILPGLAMMQRSLAQGTARLPLAEGRLVAVPRNTHDAIASGCLNAQLGAIERMRGQLPAGSPIVLSGGAAPELLAGLGGPVLHVPLLVLEGLRSAAQP